VDNLADNLHLGCQSQNTFCGNDHLTVYISPLHGYSSNTKNIYLSLTYFIILH